MDESLAKQIVGEAATEASVSIQLVSVATYCVFNVPIPFQIPMFIVGMLISIIAHKVIQAVVFDIGNFVRLAWKYRREISE